MAQVIYLCCRQLHLVHKAITVETEPADHKVQLEENLYRHRAINLKEM